MDPTEFSLPPLDLQSFILSTFDLLYQCSFLIRYELEDLKIQVQLIYWVILSR